MRVSPQLIKAFQEPYNLLCLATLVALSAALLDPLPVLIGAGAETVYLLFVPTAAWYVRSCDRRDRELQRGRLDQLEARVYPKLHTDLQHRYGHLTENRREARQRLKDEPQFNRAVYSVDCLLEMFLVLAAKEVQLRTYVTAALQFAHHSTLVIVAPVAQNGSFFDMAEEIQNEYKTSAQILQMARDAESSDVGRKARFDGYSTAFARRYEFVANVAAVLTKLQGELEKVEATVGALDQPSFPVSMEQALRNIQNVIYEIKTILQQPQEFEAYEWLMVRPQQPTVLEIPEAKSTEDHVVNTKKLLVSFGLLAVTITIFGFGTDTINVGVRYVSEYFSITLPEVQHWESWEFGALIWTAGFAIWFYRVMPLTKVDSVDKLIAPLASGGVFVLTALALITIWKEHYAHVFFLFAIACLYCWLDQKLSKNIKDPHLKRDFNESKWLADVPAVVAFGVLVVYQIYLMIYHGGEHYHKFLTETYPNGEHWALFFSGAISFQLVVSTVIFALVQSGVIRKLLHEAAAPHQ